jgi:hypothetical protein
MVRGLPCIDATANVPARRDDDIPASGLDVDARCQLAEAAGNDNSRGSAEKQMRPAAAGDSLHRGVDRIANVQFADESPQRDVAAMLYVTVENDDLACSSADVEVAMALAQTAKVPL